MLRLDPEAFYPIDAPELAQIGSPSTLAIWRHEGRGPAYCKAAKRIFYRGEDVIDWIRKHRIEPEAA